MISFTYYKFYPNNCQSGLLMCRNVLSIYISFIHIKLVQVIRAFGICKKRGVFKEIITQKLCESCDFCHHLIVMCFIFIR